MTSTRPRHLLMLLLLAGCAKPVPAENIAEADAAVLAVPQLTEFRLGPGDRIQITVWQQPDLSLEVTIAPDGTISYPLSGTMKVAGLSFAQVREQLTREISGYVADPRVAVNIVEIYDQKVVVMGEVTSPMVLQLNNGMTIIEALTVAGGIVPTARTRDILLIRGGLEHPQLFQVDVESIYEDGRLDQLVYLRRGDIIFVPSRPITNTSRLFAQLQGVLGPILSATGVYRNVVTGDSIIVPVPQ